MSLFKKIFVSSCFIFGFIANVFYQRNSDIKVTSLAKDNFNLITKQDFKIEAFEDDDEEEGGVIGRQLVTKPITPSTSSAPVIPSVPIANIPQGKYRDGEYLGNAAVALYADEFLQVKAVISGGKISDVIFVQSPNKRPQSIRVASKAMPILKQEAISVQNENVDAVSGASYTSAAFVESLGVALAKARV